MFATVRTPMTWPEAVLMVAVCAVVAFFVWCVTRND